MPLSALQPDQHVRPGQPKRFMHAVSCTDPCPEAAMFPCALANPAHNQLDAGCSHICNSRMQSVRHAIEIAVVAACACCATQHAVRRAAAPCRSRQPAAPRTALSPWFAAAQASVRRRIVATAWPECTAPSAAGTPAGLTSQLAPSLPAPS